MPPNRYKMIVINADDLGFSPAVNEAVVSAAEFGTLRSASLMATMPFADEAVELVRKRCPDLDLGLHFSLTSGKSVAPREKVPLLVDGQGHFRLGFFGLLRLLNSRRREEALRQIRRELKAQFTRLDDLRQSWPFRWNHLDSHRHVHVLPGIFEALDEESRTRNLHLRIPRECFGGVKRSLFRCYRWLPSGFVKREILNGFLQNQSGPIGYFGILESGRIDLEAFIAIFRTIADSREKTEYFEINVHPSVSATMSDTPASPDDIRFHASPWREIEWKTLMDERIFQYLDRCRLSLSGFPCHFESSSEREA